MSGVQSNVKANQSDFAADVAENVLHLASTR